MVGLGVAVGKQARQVDVKKNEGKDKPRVGDNADALVTAMKEILDVNGTLQRLRGWDCKELSVAGMLELQVLMLLYRAWRLVDENVEAKGNFWSKGRKKSVEMAMRRVGGGTTSVGGV